MKKFPIAAAALLFGTSAYAMAPSTAPTGVWVDKDPYAVTDYMAAGATALSAAPDQIEAQPATASWWDGAEPAAPLAEKTAFDTAMADDADGEVKAAAMLDQAAKGDAGGAAIEEDVDAAAEAAEAEASSAPAVAELEPADYETTALEEQPVPVENGVGGPEEHVDIAAANLSTRPAAQNYPACSPGPGDDNCIQLYEPGVRQRLASWTQPTGGFAGDAEVRMAAADEATTADTVETAMAEDAYYEQPVDDEDEIEV